MFVRLEIGSSLHFEYSFSPINHSIENSNLHCIAGQNNRVESNDSNVVSEVNRVRSLIKITG